MTSGASGNDRQQFLAMHVRASTCFQNDRGTGRCRMQKSLCKSLGVALGWVVKLLISSNKSGQYEVLCSVWVDNHNDLDGNMIVIDDTVFLGSIFAWDEGTCSVRSLSRLSLDF